MKKPVFILLLALILCITANISGVFPPCYADDIQPEQNTALLDKAEFVQDTSGAEQMVVTAHPLATQAAYDVLEQGGNAADAAIAAQLVLGLVEPQSSGLGGGGFALYYDAQKDKLFTIDGRETAPKTAHADMFLDAQGVPLHFFSASTSKQSIGQPATPDLLYTLNRRFGTPAFWDASFTRAISLAQNGFTVTPRLADSVEKYQDRLSKNNSLPYFQHADGTLLQAGDILSNTHYAKTLLNFRETGPRFLSPQYHVKQRDNLCGAYRQYKICSMTEPSSGGLTLLYILGLLEPYDLGEAPNDLAYHLYLEASKLAFADRNHYMADPDFVKTPGQRLIDKSYLDTRRRLILVNQANPTPEYGVPMGWRAEDKADHSGPEEGGTTHISIIDRFGNALSMTSSIEFAFGSGFMKDGYFLNNQLTDFSFLPEKNGHKIANRVEAGKRPRSSMSPVIIFDKNNKPVMVIGSAGGSRIIGYVAQRIIALIDWHMSPKAALAMPSLLARSAKVDAETGFDPAILASLKEKGHIIKNRALNSGMTLIHQQDALYYGAADPRREGTALGR
tara:strand:+ start:682756 stop:684441 length:1686 start_codon:yes stop_codon:yes gene_type:complete